MPKKIRLRERNRGRQPAKATVPKAGHTFVCGRCGDTHQIQPCTNPKHGYMTFYYCFPKLRLATLHNWSFIEEAT